MAPEHLGEPAAAALLVAAIGGAAIFIAGVAMAINGLTLPGRYAGADPPPNLSQLGTPQVVGGIGLLALGVLIVASMAALFGDLPRSRPLTVAVSALAAALGAAGFVLLVGASQPDALLLSGLGVAILAFGAAATILARPHS